MLEEMDGGQKDEQCDALPGILYRGTCFTFEVITEVEQVMSNECPGGCGLWGLKCAPASWENLCMRAYHQ